MRRRGSSFRALACCLLLLATAVSSCIYDYSSCPSGRGEFSVAFDWDRSRQADVAGMTLFFYPLEDGLNVWRFEIAGRDGGRVELPYGRYCMIAFNNDLPGICLENTGSASTIQASMQRRDADDDSVYVSTGMLYKTSVREIDVTPGGVSYSVRDEKPTVARDGTVICQPDSLATQFDVRLREVKGLEGIRSAYVILYGIRASVFLDDGQASEIPAALGIGLDTNTKKKELNGKACGFEVFSLIGDDYKLTLLVTTTKGTAMAKHIEINPENLNVISRHHVLISVTGIELPDGSCPGDISGIEADVEGWEMINIDVGPTIGNS